MMADAVEFNYQLSRTVQILNVPEHLRDWIELCVEHEEHGGGEYEKIEYDDDLQNLTVTFVDAKGLRNTVCLFFSFYLHDAMLARGTSPGHVSVCVCVYLSQVGVLSKGLNESRWFWAWELPSAYTTLC